MDWEQLHHFSALARAGTLTGAARLLGVEHTTVARRVQALEQALGKSLFARSAEGHKLTEAGQQLLPAIEAMEKAAGQLEVVAAQAEDEALALSGVVRVGATEGLGTQLLAPALARLSLQWPQLSIDLLALPRLLHLSRREVDIVISLERPKRGSIIVSKLADYQLFLYGEREYLARRPLVQQREDLRHHRFVHYVDDLLFSKELQLLDQLYRPERFVFRSTSILAQYEAVKAGAGLGVLPAFLADRNPTLAKVLPSQACFSRTFWMSMPEELKHVARVQTVWQTLKNHVRNHL